MRSDPASEGDARPDRGRQLLADTVAALKLVPRGFAVVTGRSRLLGNRWLEGAQVRRLHFIDRRGERVQEIRRLSRIVLVWPLVATIGGIVLALLVGNIFGLALLLTFAYGAGAVRRRRLPPKRKLGESASQLNARWHRRQRVAAVAIVVVFGLLAVLVHEWSPVLLRLGVIAVLIGHFAFRYAAWFLDMFVLSSTALWRFQGLVDFRVSSLEYSKIQAGPNATSGLAAWAPIGMIEMDSAAQTGDIPMQRIGPVWGAEELAVTIFAKRKATGQRVRIMNVDDFVRTMNE